MDDDLHELAVEAANFLNDTDGPILLFSHYDCDGIASAIIAHQMLERAGKEFEHVFLDELTEAKLKEDLFDREQPVVLFTDIGSGQLETVRDVINDRQIAVLDHHEPQDEGDELAAHVNPHLVGIDGGEQISGAGVTYLVAEAMDENNIDLLPYALIGATGDIQTDDDTYLGLNQEFVDKAIEHDLIEVKKGLKIFGRQGKKLTTALARTTDPYLQGITNNESGAVQFLRSIGLELKDDGDWRSLADISFEEEKQIVHGLITRGYGDIEDLLGDVYILDNGWEIREFASLLNACGRLERPEDGLKICLERDFDLARTVKQTYGRKIGRYLSFVEDNVDNSEVVKDIGPGTLIDAGSKIHANMIGTVATICIKSDILSGPVVMGLAEKEEDHLKISARATDEVIGDDFAVNSFMEDVCAEVGGEGGGHQAAAGGKIPRENRERFINVVEERLTESVQTGETIL
ncbi:MAG: DHH family phosphoesterase [Candidatus Nanohaloarchaea archaeon]|nr:DHH family phosphoesterase [Candidatus Nanohaloarchaea archaeon]